MTTCEKHSYVFNESKGEVCYFCENERISNMGVLNIDNIVFDGIDKNDSPDFSDAFIVSADKNGIPMSEEEIELLNNESGFVHERLMGWLC